MNLNVKRAGSKRRAAGWVLLTLALIALAGFFTYRVWTFSFASVVADVVVPCSAWPLHEEEMVAAVEAAARDVAPGFSAHPDDRGGERFRIVNGENTDRYTMELTDGQSFLYVSIERQLEQKMRIKLWRGK